MNFKDLPSKQEVVELTIDKEGLIDKKPFKDATKAYGTQKINFPKGDQKPK